MRTSRSPGHEPHGVARRDPPAAEAPGHDRPAAPHGKDAVDRRAARHRPSAFGVVSSAASASRTASIPSPVWADASSTGTPASVVRARSALDLCAKLGPSRLVGREVSLRHDREPAPDSERVEQLEVLQRLRVRSVVRRDDEQRRVDLARPDEHVADEPVVPRDVDEVDDPPVIEHEMRIPHVDRHPAPPLLGQPVRVDAGERTQERRLAVVDVPGRADDEACGRPDGVLSHRRRRPESRTMSASSSAGSIVRRSTTTSSCSIRPTTARRSGPKPGEQRSSRRPGSATRPRRQRLARQRPAADGRLGLDDARAMDRLLDRTRPSIERLHRDRDLPPDRDLADRDAGPVQPERRRDRGEDHLVGPYRAGQRIAPQLRHQVRPPDDEPRLRPADELVAAERHEVRAGGEPLGRRRLVGEPEGGRVEQCAGTKVVDDERAVHMCGLGERGGVGRLGEPLLAEVRRVHPQDEPRPPAASTSSKSADARPVRGPHLDQLRAGPPHDVGDPHAAADLDQLAAAHRDAAAPRQPDRERERRRVVGHHERVLGARQRDQVLLGCSVPAAAAARRPVQLEEQRSSGGIAQPGSRPPARAPARGSCGR